MKTTFLRRLALSLTFSSTLPLLAFTDADWVSLNSGGSGTIRAIVVDATGNLYVGGSFSSIGGVAANNIAKWDGRAWSALGSGAGALKALAMDGTNLYAGGYSAGTYSVVRWNGTTWSTLGSSMNGTVYALAVMGTNLYAGGDFTSAGGVEANCVAKWDGSAWSALGQGIRGGYPMGAPGYPYTIVGPWVNALAVHGTNLYAGGLFMDPNDCIGRWDGSPWWWSLPGFSGIPMIDAIAVSGTNVYAGSGGMLSPSPNKIAQWNGSGWSVLGWLSTGDNDGVTALALNGTDLYAGGLYTGVGGANATNIAKYNGSAWSALGSGVNGKVYALAVDGAGHLFVGGSFTTAGTNFSPMIAQANIGAGFGPARFGQLAYSPLTGFSCTFRDATPGQPYRIQTRSSLTSGTWTDLTNFTYTAPLTLTNPASATNTFYRAVSP